MRDKKWRGIGAETNDLEVLMKIDIRALLINLTTTQEMVCRNLLVAIG